MKLLTIIFSLLLSSAIAHAEVSIQKIKDKKLLVTSDFEELKAGEIFYVVDTNSMKKGVAKIVKVDGDRAIAILGKGSANIGDFLSKRAKVRKTTRRTVKRQQPVDDFTADDYGSDDKVYYKKRKRKTYTSQEGRYLGAMIGFSNYTLDSQITSSQVANMTGSGFALKAFYDRPLLNWLNLRLELGYEDINAASESQSFCGNSQTCYANIASITADAWGRFHFLKSIENFKPWIGGGIYMMLPISDDTNALDQDSIGLSTNFEIGGGIDWHFSPGKIIPIQVQYTLLPSADSADGSFLSFKVGYGWSFK